MILVDSKKGNRADVPCKGDLNSWLILDMRSDFALSRLVALRRSASAMILLPKAARKLKSSLDVSTLCGDRVQILFLCVRCRFLIGRGKVLTLGQQTILLVQHPIMA